MSQTRHTRGWNVGVHPILPIAPCIPLSRWCKGRYASRCEDTPEQKLAKLEENLSQSHQPLEETVPLFGALLSVPIPEDCYATLNLTPQRQRQKTLEAIVAIILELSERQPVLF